MWSIDRKNRLHGLVAATHTPFDADGSLHLAVVEKQAAHLLAHRVMTAFVGGSTGEGHSLSLEERLALARRWSEVAQGTGLRVVVHVGSNCLADAKALAAHSERLGVTGIAALAPSYFKPRSLDALIACVAEVASAAPATPFYFYDIPGMTGVTFSMPDFLDRARDRVPTLAGIKFTNPDLMAYQLCLRADAGAWDVPFGSDEYLLAALALGAKGAVGSSYNFAAPVYQRIIAAFESGDLATARDEQFLSVRLIGLLASFGYMGAAKAVMAMLEIPVGPPRLPNEALTHDQIRQLRGRLEAIGFFEAIAR